MKDVHVILCFIFALKIAAYVNRCFSVYGYTALFFCNFYRGEPAVGNNFCDTLFASLDNKAAQNGVHL